MAEGMKPGLRIVRVLGERCEHDARRAEHDRDRSRLDDAEAEGRGLLVAGAGDLGRLADGRQPRGRDVEGRQDLVGPASVGHVEEQGSGGVSGVDRPLAREPKPDVVLREHDSPDAGVDVGLVAAQPQQLRCGEARQGAVSRQRDEALEADQLLDLGALGHRPLVVPEDGGPEDASLGVEADQPVHLTRQADPGRLEPEPPESDLARPPPVLGVLLRPAGLRCGELVALLRRVDHLAVGRDGDRLHAGRADVEPDEGAHSAPRAWYTSS